MSDIKNVKDNTPVDEKNTLAIPAWVGIITLCIAVASGSWAISAEVHNMRTNAILYATEKNERSIVGLKEVDSDRAVQMERLSSEIENISTTLDEVRSDVKSLITAPR